MEDGDRNELLDRYCQLALAASRNMAAALRTPAASKGLVKMAARHDEQGYAVLCEWLAGRGRGGDLDGVRPHARPVNRGGVGRG